MATYEVEERGDGSVDRVLKDRRAFAYDLVDIDHALSLIESDHRRSRSQLSIQILHADGRTEVLSRIP